MVLFFTPFTPFLLLTLLLLLTPLLPYNGPMPSTLFVGGGSIGHIAPAVAVAKELQKLKPQVEITFVCSKRNEDAEFLKHSGFSYKQLDAPRLSLTFLWKFFRAQKAARNLLEALKPQVIFSKGGYVSIPVCYAAHVKNIPIVLHESDAVSGRANKIVSKWAKHICFGFPSQSTVNCQQSTVTGNPVRPEITKGNKEEGSRITGFTGDKPILLIVGGTQGAQTLNEVVIKNANELLNLCDIIHLTGLGKKGLKKQKGYWSKEFAFEELPHLYAIADVALSRAGANFIAELAANNIPTILVPLEGAAHNHQLRNAEVMSQSKGFTLLRQKELNESLVDKIQHLITSKLANQQTSKLPNASGQIAEILSKYLDS